MDKRRSPEEVAAAAAVLRWAHSRNLEVQGGQGAKNLTLDIRIRRGKLVCLLLTMHFEADRAFAEVQLRHFSKCPPFADRQSLAEFARRLLEVSAVDHSSDAARRAVAAGLEPLADDQARAQFLGVLDWAVGQILTSSQVG